MIRRSMQTSDLSRQVMKSRGHIAFGAAYRNEAKAALGSLVRNSPGLSTAVIRRSALEKRSFRRCQAAPPHSPPFPGESMIFAKPAV